MKAFRYTQNNSGGFFHNDPYELIVVAENHNHANTLAEREIYFDGCANHRDCSCCGDRWSRALWDDADEYEVFHTLEEATAYSVSRLDDRNTEKPVVLRVVTPEKTYDIAVKRD